MEAVHGGDCWAAKKSGRCRPASREQAVEAIRRQVPACPHCPGQTNRQCPLRCWQGRLLVRGE
ncbi:DUF6233 domain-containing protein [Streptomyces sp. NPDC054794]